MKSFWEERVAKYTSRPVTITAIRVGRWNQADVIQFLGDQLEAMQENEETNQIRYVFLNPHKHADNLIANEGDWIIKGLEGEFYPCVDSVFKAKYEPTRP